MQRYRNMGFHNNCKSGSDISDQDPLHPSPFTLHPSLFTIHLFLYSNTTGMSFGYFTV